MISIQEVNTKRELMTFIRFPRKLYRDNPYYIPALEKGELADFTSNPATKFCTHKQWLARRNGKVVGRIAGIINHKCNEHWHQQRIRFGWIDFIDDPEVAKALLDTVEAWGRENGLAEIHGPSGFSNLDKQGMLVEGFEESIPIAGIYNFSYYPAMLERLGYAKDVDWIQYEMNASQPVPDSVERISDIICRKYNVTLKTFRNNKEILPYAHKFFYALNDAFKDIYNFIPLTDEEIEYQTQKYFPLLRPDLISIVTDSNDDVIGFALSMPSFTEAFKKAGGKLFPFGWYHIMKAQKNYDIIDLYYNGVHPDWQNKGIHALYHNALNKTYIKQGARLGISTQQLENNMASRVWEKYNGRQHIRRRCYVKAL
jgi:GNAT superfamily N-acetyltransferase